MSSPIFDLEDLDALACEPANLPFELSRLNNYHGSGTILREYAGIPEDEPLAFGIEHCVPYDQSVPHMADFLAELPIYLATTRTRAVVYEKHGDVDARPTGFAYGYARRNFHRRYGKAPVDRRGTVVFPHKSTKTLDRDFDRESFAARLADLPEHFHPITVCLYWKDVLRGTAAPFEKHGFRIVTCGHFLHPDFLLRFYDLCRRHRYSCSNSIATSFSLSVLSGCQFFYLDTGALTVRRGDEVEQFEKDPFLEPALAQKARSLSPYPLTWKKGLLQKPFAKLLAGEMWMRSPRRIRQWNLEGLQKLLVNQDTGWKPTPGDYGGGLSCWLPDGVDFDGWAFRKGSITFQGGDQAAGFGEMYILLPVSKDVAGLTVTTPNLKGGKKKKEFKVSSGYHRIRFPLPANEGPVKITWEAQGDAKISETDCRMRPFRIAALSVTANSDVGRHSCSPEEIREFFE